MRRTPVLASTPLRAGLLAVAVVAVVPTGRASGQSADLSPSAAPIAQSPATRPVTSTAAAQQSPSIAPASPDPSAAPPARPPLAPPPLPGRPVDGPVGPAGGAFPTGGPSPIRSADDVFDDLLPATDRPPAAPLRPTPPDRAAAPATPPARSVDGTATDPGNLDGNGVGGDDAGPSGDPNVETSEAGGPGAAVAAGVAPGAGGSLMDEGAYVVDRVGRLVMKAGRPTLAFEADGRAMADPPVGLLPNRQLQRLEASSASAGSTGRFRVTGQVTTYRGRNYLLLDKAVPVRD